MTPPGEIDRAWVNEYEREEMQIESGKLVALADIMVNISQCERSEFEFSMACCDKWPGFEMKLMESALDDEYFGNLSFPPVPQEIAVILLYLMKNVALYEESGFIARRDKSHNLAKTYLTVFKYLMIGELVEKIERDQTVAETIAARVIQMLVKSK